MTKYLLDLSLESQASLKVPRSKVAAAAVLIAFTTNKSGDKRACSRQDVQKITGYSSAELSNECVLLTSLCNDAQNNSSLYVNRKHADVYNRMAESNKLSGN